MDDRAHDQPVLGLDDRRPGSRAASVSGWSRVLVLSQVLVSPGMSVRARVAIVLQHRPDPAPPRDANFPSPECGGEWPGSHRWRLRCR